MTHHTVAVAGLALILMTVTTMRVTFAEQGRTGPRDRDGRGAVAGASTIVGRVFDAATNAPVPRAQVQALSDETLVDAITDEQGRYQLAELPAGQWRVTISKGGYFTREVGQRRPFESPPPVLLGSRQRLTADIALSRGGVIAGRISDDTGEPLAGLRVGVYRARMSAGYRRLETVGAADFTDDTGSYRIYGLPPGDYFVAASLRVAPTDSVVATTYAPTYFPGTGDLAGAQRIRIGLGSEAAASFPLLPVRQVRVSGSVTTAAGAPASAFLALTSEATEFGNKFGADGVSVEDGTFSISDVPPGRYTLTATLRGDGPSETAFVTVTVGSEDLTGLSLQTGKPAFVRGRVVSASSRAVPSGVEITAVAARAMGSRVSSSSKSPAFELEDLSEPFRVRVEGLPDGWAVESVVVAGVDVTDSVVTLQTGQVADARIVLTDRGGVVTGTATSAGKPTRAEVLVFADDAAKWTYPSRHIRVAHADDRGRFRVSGLPPGQRYLAVAADYLEDGEEHDPEFLERMREAATPFEIETAQPRALDLPVLER